MAKDKGYTEFKVSDVVKRAGGEKYLKANFIYAENVIDLLLQANEDITDEKFKAGYSEVGLIDYKLHDWAYNNFSTGTIVMPEAVIADYTIEKLHQECGTNLQKAWDIIKNHSVVVRKKVEKQFKGFEVTNYENFDYTLERVLMDQYNFQYLSKTNN